MSRHSYLGILLSVVLTVGLIAIGAIAYGRRDQLLARYLAARSSEISDRGLEGHFRCLAALGEEGVPALVGALASSRPAARQAAITVIDEVVAQQSARHADSPVLERLAIRLADVADTLTEPAYAAATRWSSRLVADQYRNGLRNAAVLTACRRIQETRTSKPETVPTLANSPAPDSSAVAEAETGAATVDEVKPEVPPTAQAEVARNGISGDTPHDSRVDLSVPDHPARLPQHVETTSATMPQPEQIALDAASPGELGVSATEAVTAEKRAEIPTASPLSEDEAAGPKTVASLQPGRPETPANGLSQSASVPPAVQAELARRPDGLSDRDLLTLLHHDDQEVSGWAENELRRRGISREEIALGRLITDPDPGVRARLARGLPRTPYVDRVVWLLEMTHDPHPAVRLVALASIVEVRDEMLEARARSMAENDPDPTVRERAQQVAGILTDRTVAPSAPENPLSADETSDRGGPVLPTGGTANGDAPASSLPSEPQAPQHDNAITDSTSKPPQIRRPAARSEKSSIADDDVAHRDGEAETSDQKPQKGSWHARYTPLSPEPLEAPNEMESLRIQPRAIDEPTDEFLPPPPPGRSVSVPTIPATSKNMDLTERSARTSKGTASSEASSSPDPGDDPAAMTSAVRVSHWRPAKPKKEP